MAKRYGRPVRRALCPLLVLLAFLSGLLLLPGQALASDRSYQITQVDIDATVDADGTLHVVETRTFDFDGSFNGVYWDIPTGYNPNNGKEVEVNVTSAGESTAGSLLAFQLSDSDEDGTYSISDRGSIQRLKIYSAHRNEKARFTIAYDATGIATRWQDTGELYWKFVSDGWDVESQNVTCTLHLPVPAGESVTAGQNVRAWGHGPLDGSVSFSGSDVVFTASGVGTDEYAEMRVTFPQSWLSGLSQSSAGRLDSILSEEQQWADEANARRTRARILVWGTGALAAIAAVGTVVLALLKKRKYDRDNEPDFKDKYFRDVPTSDHPAVLGALFNGGSVEGKELTATLMRLTDEGYISLEKVTTKKKGLFGDKVREDYRVTKLKGMPRSSGSARDKATHTVDSKTLSLLFKTISDDGEKLYFSHIESFAKKEPELYHSAYEKWEGAVTGKYAERFEDGGEKGNGRGWLVLAGVIDCILAFVVFVAYLIFEASVLAMIGLPLLLVAAAVAAFVTAASMKRINREGIETLAKLRALRSWLTDFTHLSEAVPSDVVLWNRLLVMAVVLDVADEVIDQLRATMPQVLDDPAFMPTYGWYYYRWHGGSSPAAVFTQSMQSAHHVSDAALAASSDSSGGGGGGGTVTPPKPALEKGDHYAYIIGYQDGTIRANGKITRAEVATIFFRLLTDESRDEFWSETNEYSDVSGDQWFNNANITRAELAVIAAKFDDLTSGTSKLTDIEGHWAEDYINSAYNKGWVSGYPDGSYMPDNAITRAEVVTLVNRVLERAVDVEGMLDDMVTWSDNLPSDWYYEAIQEATNSHDYERPETEEFEEWTKIEEPRDWSELEG